MGMRGLRFGSALNPPKYVAANAAFPRRAEKARDCARTRGFRLAPFSALAG